MPAIQVLLLGGGYGWTETVDIKCTHPDYNKLAFAAVLYESMAQDTDRDR
jgi:hypothetical protein